ncbi:MAG: DUF2309 family protein, partial [Gammaproteobacteria bacterium]|nr:DUF2309 family protein [Gammaproteobacteria bacterium]
MTTAIETSITKITDNQGAVAAACSRIAPTWPLDRMIAVNPLWGRTSAPLPEVAGELATLSGSRLLMPRAWYREQWDAGVVSREHLASAIAESGATTTPDQLLAALDEAQPASTPLPLYSDAVDATTDGVHQMSWHDYVLQNISQLCASYFDDGQAQIQPDREGGLYAMWRRYVSKDMSPRFLMQLSGYRDAVRDLPTEAGAAIDFALDELEVPLPLRESYLSALLYSVNGWASWCAYLRWQAGLEGGNDDHIVELLSIRLAWEWLLHRCVNAPEVALNWQGGLVRWEQAVPAARDAQGPDWLWQRALERAYQEQVSAGLAAAKAPAPAPVSVQAAFCIDVRSEVFRRALEAQSPAIKTLGFAGFFGLPIDYLALGADEARPQLPGLLAPALRVADTCSDDSCATDLPAKRHARLGKANRLKQFKTGPLSTFSFVETGGPLYALKLLGQSLGFGRPEAAAAQAGLSRTE